MSHAADILEPVLSHLIESEQFPLADAVCEAITAIREGILGQVMDDCGDWSPAYGSRWESIRELFVGMIDAVTEEGFVVLDAHDVELLAKVFTTHPAMAQKA